MGKVCHVCGVPPSLCFAIKRDMGLLPAAKRRILEQDGSGLTRGLEGVAAEAPRRLRAAATGPVRAARKARPSAAADSESCG